MNVKELKNQMEKKGFSPKSLSEKTGIGLKAFEERLAGEKDFLLWEIIKITNLLSLENREMLKIFFDD